jgi:hypothetical protein
VDIDGYVYYSDIVSTFNAAPYKKRLLLGHTRDLDLNNISISQLEGYEKIIKLIES